MLCFQSRNQPSIENKEIGLKAIPTLFSHGDSDRDGDRDRASPSSTALQTGTDPVATRTTTSAVPVCRLRRVRFGDKIVLHTVWVHRCNLRGASFCDEAAKPPSFGYGCNYELRSLETGATTS